MAARVGAGHRRHGPGRGQPDAGGRSSSTRRCTTGCSQAALAGADADGIHGKDVTPYLLARFHHDTDGRLAAPSTPRSSCETPPWPGGSRLAHSRIRP